MILLKQLPRLVCLFGFTTLLLLLPFSTVASRTTSNTNYNPIHYDRMRHFTPDGRLLQVEYAMRASEHSAPVVACQLDDETLVLLSLSFKKSRPQERMVVLEDGIVVVLSGVLADNLALLRQAHKEWLDWKYMFGEENASPQIMMHVVSQKLAEECHWNSFQGGIRPYGATQLLVGVVGDAKFRMLQTDPSGSIVEIPTTANNNKDPITLWTIFGGNEEERQKIQKAIQNWNDKNHNQAAATTATSMMWQKLQSLTKVMLETTVEEGEQLTTVSTKKKKRSSKPKKQSKGQSPKKEQERPEEKQPQQPQLETVLISKKLGIHRLTKPQIQQLLLQED